MAEIISITNECISIIDYLSLQIKVLRARKEHMATNQKNLTALCEVDMGNLGKKLCCLSDQFREASKYQSPEQKRNWESEIDIIVANVRDFNDKATELKILLPNVDSAETKGSIQRQFRRLFISFKNANKVAETIETLSKSVRELTDTLFHRIDRLEDFRRPAAPFASPVVSIPSTTTDCTPCTVPQPECVATPPKTQSAAGRVYYKTRPGDSLWQIALSMYNNPVRFLEIHAANKEVIPNPDFVPWGKQILIPGPVVPPPTEGLLHVARAGETLADIAQKHFNDPLKYEEIYEANRKYLSNPNTIFPDMVLSIPQ